MNETTRLRKMLEIVVYQYDLIKKLKGRSKESLESSARDLFDLIMIRHPRLLQLYKDPDSRQNTAINIIEQLQKIEEHALEELNRKTSQTRKS